MNEWKDYTPMLIVACFWITSGLSGLSFVTSMLSSGKDSSSMPFSEPDSLEESSSSSLLASESGVRLLSLLAGAMVCKLMSA